MPFFLDSEFKMNECNDAALLFYFIGGKNLFALEIRKVDGMKKLEVLIP